LSEAVCYDLAMGLRVVPALVAASLFVARFAPAEVPDAPFLRPIQVAEGLCFDERSLSQALEPWTHGPIDPHLGVHVRRHGRGIAFDVERDQVPVGARELALPAASCAEATEAVAVAVALALDANRAQSDAQPPPPPPVWPRILVPDLPADRDDDATADAPSSRSVSPLSLTATGMATVGVLGKPSPGIAVGLSRSWTRLFATEVEAFAAWLSIDDPYDTYDPTRLLGAALDACATTWERPFELRGCLGAAFGAVSSKDVKTVGWVAPVVRAEARYDPLGLFLSVDGFEPVLRPARRIESWAGYASPVAPFGLAISGGLAFDL
jgi:hypothetical protein